MGSLNRATLIGNVGKTPEVKPLQNGSKVEARTEWHTVVAWAGLATIVERYLQQGQQVYVEGKIRYRSYDNQQGQKRYITEIVAENIVLLKNGQPQQQGGYTAEQPPQANDCHINQLPVISTLFSIKLQNERTGA